MVLIFKMKRRPTIWFTWLPECLSKDTGNKTTKAKRLYGRRTKRFEASAEQPGSEKGNAMLERRNQAEMSPEGICRAQELPRQTSLTRLHGLNTRLKGKQNNSANVGNEFRYHQICGI
jgi:hypothetical protein